jgi:formiminoglutamase
VCLGAQSHSVSGAHLAYAVAHGCRVRWCRSVAGSLCKAFAEEEERLRDANTSVWLSIDADAVRMTDVPGVSAPNPLGLTGEEVVRLARLAGESTAVSSLDIVEINPRYDRDGQSARWAALVVWNFLMGKSTPVHQVSD